jgi:mortality factor 4-like protein 1
LKGLRCYFDKALPAMLLYKKERDQYTEEVKGDVSPSTVYGAEHLLRLFGMSNFQLHEIVLYFWFIL